MSREKKREKELEREVAHMWSLCRGKWTFLRTYVCTCQSVYKIKNGIIRESLGFFLSFRLLLLRTHEYMTHAQINLVPAAAGPGVRVTGIFLSAHLISNNSFSFVNFVVLCKQ